MDDISPVDMEPMEEAFEDDSLAPLKRNHACLQCKKRKVKCDGTKPSCAPCLRSHAHAVRAANRAGARAPILHCEWADSDSPEHSPGREDSLPTGLGEMQIKATPPNPKKKVSGGAGIGPRKASVEKEKARRQEDEKDTLLARIAELEARLAGLTPPSSESAGRITASTSAGSASTSASASNPSNPSPNPFAQSMPTPPELNWDFSTFFMVPAFWPKNLPAPYLLEHLVDTFFSLAPQVPRIINRAKLMTRLQLPPSHKNFPHPALLHAICATAAQYTAWVTSIPIGQLDSAVAARMKRGEDFENFEDFALAQAESARRSIHQTFQTCIVGSPDSVFEILQAQVLVSEVWICRGMYLKGWSNGGQAIRYVKGLELANRNYPKRYKRGILEPPADDVDREERLATTWQTFISEVYSGVSRYWPISLDDREMFCKLPASAIDFNRKDGHIPENPQDAKDPKLYSEHPVPDAFVLNCKVAMLCSRVARFVRDWTQRDIRPGDEMLGMQLQIFKDIVRDIHDFQRTIPEEYKNVFRLQNMNQGIDALLMGVHIMPNVALLMIHEAFVNWDEPQAGGVMHMHKAYEAIIGVLHLIPSNTDVSLILTSDLAMNLHSTGRIIADFIQQALSKQAYGLAVRYRADLATIQALLSRFGQKHPVGQFSMAFLENYLNNIITGKDNELYPCSTNIKAVIDVLHEPDAPMSSEPDVLQDLFGPTLDQNIGDFGVPMSIFPGDVDNFMPASMPAMPLPTAKGGMAQFGSVDNGVFLSADMGASPLDFNFGQADSDPWSFLQPPGVPNQ